MSYGYRQARSRFVGQGLSWFLKHVRYLLEDDGCHLFTSNVIQAISCPTCWNHRKGNFHMYLQNAFPRLRRHARSEIDFLPIHQTKACKKRLQNSHCRSSSSDALRSYIEYFFWLGCARRVRCEKLIRSLDLCIFIWVRRFS